MNHFSFLLFRGKVWGMEAVLGRSGASSTIITHWHADLRDTALILSLKLSLDSLPNSSSVPPCSCCFTAPVLSISDQCRLCSFGSQARYTRLGLYIHTLKKIIFKAGNFVLVSSWPPSAVHIFCHGLYDSKLRFIHVLQYYVTPHNSE